MTNYTVEKYKAYGFRKETPEEITASAIEEILIEIQKTLAEMRRIAVFAAENKLTDFQRLAAQTRINELKKELDGIASMLTPPVNIELQ